MSAFMRILSDLFPVMVANRAYRILNNPQVRKLRAHEIAVLETAETAEVRFKGFKIKLYRWGDGARPVMLVHGWEGQAGNFADVVPRLLEAGFSVIAFDGPSHGFSSIGETNVFDFSELTGILLRQFSPTMLMSHSFGSVATTYALYNNREIPVNKYVLFTTPDRFRDRIDEVSRLVGISDKAKQKLIQRIELETGIAVDSFNVSDYVPHANVARALILHDVDDKVVPISYARKVGQVWPQAEFEAVSGTGHFRILRDAGVIDKAIEFLKQT